MGRYARIRAISPTYHLTYASVITYLNSSKVSNQLVWLLWPVLAYRQSLDEPLLADHLALAVVISGICDHFNALSSIGFALWKKTHSSWCFCFWSILPLYVFHSRKYIVVFIICLCKSNFGWFQKL